MTRTQLLRYILGISIGVALLWMIAPRLVAGSKQHWAKNSSDAEIWVADRYIPAHHPLDRKQLRVVRWPLAYVPPGALLIQETLSDAWDRPRFSAAVAIPEGQPITRTLLFESGQGDSLAALLRPGQSAVSFEVERAQGAGGWVKPGDTIAIFAAKPEMRLMIPSITVLAVDGKRLNTSVELENAKRDESDPLVAQVPASSLVITVRANPREATALIHTATTGHVHVVIRSSGDDLPWSMAN